MIKKFFIRVMVLLLVFAAAVFCIGKIVNRDTPDTTQEMSNATLPLVYMLEGDTQINCLHGHKDEMDVTALRDALTPIDSNRSVIIQIDSAKKVSGISFEVLTADGKTSMENTKVTKLSEDDDYVTATLELQNKILINTEYMLKIALTVGEQEIYYYTRIIQEDGLNVSSYVDFVLGFYQNCLQGNDLNIEEYVEPDADGDTSSFAYVDIHSSISQIVWKGFSPTVYYKPTPSIRELNESTATIVLDYMVTATDENGETGRYRVWEYYRMRYNESRIYLLDFERKTSQIFDPDNTILDEKGIILGVADRDITYKSDEGDNYFAFVREGALWCYDLSGNKLVQVFSFPQDKNSDARDTYNQNDIQIVNIDEQGNIYFLVCGYMNRGIHEGESGVAVYYYDGAASIVTECLFVDTSQAFSLLKQDAKALSYVTQDRGTFYLLVNEEAYAMDMTSHEVEKIASNLMHGCYASSSSGSQFAWMNGSDSYDSTTITIMDLETGAKREITCEGSSRLKLLGFIGEDVVYGTADTSDIDTSYGGLEVFPMSQIKIVNQEGETVKTYTPQGCYVSEVQITDNLMTLKRMKKTADGYEETSDDQIVGSTAIEESSLGLTTITSSTMKELQVLKVGSTLKTSKAPQVIHCKQQIYEGSKTIQLETKEKSSDVYYVYAKGALDTICTSVSEAITIADGAYGVVVNGSQQMIWERGNKQTKLDLSPANFPAAFLEYTLDAEYLQSKMSQQVLDLTGCTLEQVLYFVSEGYPVLAKTADGAVIIGGYDEYNTRLLLEGEEELSYAGLQDSTAMFEEAGNVFLTYIDLPEE